MMVVMLTVEVSNGDCDGDGDDNADNSGDNDGGAGGDVGFGITIALSLSSWRGSLWHERLLAVYFQMPPNLLSRRAWLYGNSIYINFL